VLPLPASVEDQHAIAEPPSHCRWSYRVLIDSAVLEAQDRRGAIGKRKVPVHGVRWFSDRVSDTDGRSDTVRQQHVAARQFESRKCDAEIGHNQTAPIVYFLMAGRSNSTSASLV